MQGPRLVRKEHIGPAVAFGAVVNLGTVHPCPVQHGVVLVQRTPVRVGMEGDNVQLFVRLCRVEGMDGILRDGPDHAFFQLHLAMISIHAISSSTCNEPTAHGRVGV